MFAAANGLSAVSFVPLSLHKRMPLLSLTRYCARYDIPWKVWKTLYIFVIPHFLSFRRRRNLIMWFLLRRNDKACAAFSIINCFIQYFRQSQISSFLIIPILNFCHSDEGGISALLATFYNCFACSLTLESSFLRMTGLICFYFLRKFALYLCAQVSDAINRVSTSLHHCCWNSRFIILCNISNQLDVFWSCSATTTYNIY